VGKESLRNSTGNNNTALGFEAGDNITTGSSNIIIGRVDAPSATGSNQINIGNYIHTEVGSTNNHGNIDVTMDSSTNNVLAISQNTAVSLFGGGNAFSGFVVINDINATGQTAIFICGGGVIKLVSQTSSAFVNTTSPNAASIGWYISGLAFVLKPGRTGTTHFRIVSFRTRTAQ
jgi:hypothetical protein